MEVQAISPLNKLVSNAQSLVDTRREMKSVNGVFPLRLRMFFSAP